MKHPNKHRGHYGDNFFRFFLKTHSPISFLGDKLAQKQNGIFFSKNIDVSIPYGGFESGGESLTSNLLYLKNRLRYGDNFSIKRLGDAGFLYLDCTILMSFMVDSWEALSTSTGS